MEKKEYDLFRLLVRSDNKLKAEFYGSKDREGFPQEEVEAKLILTPDGRYIIELLNKKLSDAGITEGELDKLGTRMYDVLFPLRIGNLFEDKLRSLKPGEERGLRLSITVEEGSEVMNWPLEFLKGPYTISWLASRRELTLSRRVTFEQYFKPGKPAKRPLKVLMVLSRPEGMGGVMAAAVIEELGEWATSEKEETDAEDPPIQITLLGIPDAPEDQLKGVNYLRKKATIDNFRHHFNQIKPDILHFIGHGEVQEDKGQLALVNEDNHPNWLSSTALTDIILSFSPRLVVLQACHTARKEISSATRDSFLSMAEYLVRIQIPAVVAMQFEFRNNYAIEFAKGFYGSLARGLYVDAAVQEGRSSLYDDHYLSERSFGAPVLYMYSPYVIIEDTKEAKAPVRPTERMPMTGASQFFPGGDTLVQDLGFTSKAVKGGLYDLAVEMLDRTKNYLSAGDMEPWQVLMVEILDRQINRIGHINQIIASGGDAQLVDELIKPILEDLDMCIKIYQFSGTSKGASDLQPSAGATTRDRGGPPTGRAGGRPDPYPHDGPKQIT